jgi:hypothetical protein
MFATDEIFSRKMNDQARLSLVALEDIDPANHSTSHAFACRQGLMPSITVGSRVCLSPRFKALNNSCW